MRNLSNLKTHYKIAYLKEALTSESVSDSVKKALQQKIDFLKSEGHTVEGIDFPLLKYGLPTYYILTTAEASSNLSRYDGVKYGFRSSEATDIESMYKKTRGEGFGPEVQQRIMLGTFVLSASYYDAYYTKAQKVRAVMKESIEKQLEKYDFLMMPTTPGTAFKINDTSKKDPLTMYYEDLFTVQANVAGVPAISFPAGKDDKNLPVGLQLLGKHFDEAGLLSITDYLMNSQPTKQIAH